MRLKDNWYVPLYPNGRWKSLAAFQILPPMSVGYLNRHVDLRSCLFAPEVGRMYIASLSARDVCDLSPLQQTTGRRDFLKPRSIFDPGPRYENLHPVFIAD